MLKLLSWGFLSNIYPTCLGPKALQSYQIFVCLGRCVPACYFSPVLSFSHTVSAPSGLITPCCFPPAWPGSLDELWPRVWPRAGELDVWVHGEGRGPQGRLRSLVQHSAGPGSYRQEAVIRTRVGSTPRSFFPPPASVCCSPEKCSHIKRPKLIITCGWEDCSPLMWDNLMLHFLTFIAVYFTLYQRT